MKIALLGDASSIHIVKWVNSLSEVEGNVVFLLSSHNVSNLISKKVRVIKLGLPPKFSYLVSGFYINKILRNISPDIVNAHYATGYGLIASFITGYPTLLSVWGSDVYLFPNKSPFHKYFIQRNLKQSCAIASTSIAMKDLVEELVPDQNVYYTPFGVPECFFASQANRVSEQGSKVTIGTVKTLKPIYGIDLLIKAVAILFNDRGYRNIQVKIAGTGPELTILEQLAHDLGISELVDFLGYIGNEEVPELLGTFDIFVALSRSESFGVSVVEAGAAGLPSVVSSADGLKEVVINNVSGYVVDIDDYSSAANYLEKLILSSSLREDMGKKANEHIRCEYSESSVINNMMSVYKEVVEKYQG